MGWTTESTPEVLTESPAGSGATGTGIELEPRETIQFRVKRTDGFGEDWGVEVYASLNNAEYGSVPIVAKRYTSGQREGGAVVTGPAYVRVRILNVDGVPTVAIETSVTYVKDQVAF